MIYLILNADQGFCKIGYSINPDKRLRAIKNGNPYELFLVSVIEGSKKTEKEIHAMFAHLRMEGEWFIYADSIKEYFNAPEMRCTFISNKFSSDIAPFINSPTSFKLMFYLLSHEAGKHNGIISSKAVYERFNEHQVSKIPDWKMTYRTFLNCMDELKESKALTKVGRGHYYFNPHIVWKEDRNERVKFIQDEHKEGKRLSHNPVKQIDEIK